MLQRLREALTLVLLTLLPLHAFLVTVGTRMIAGPGSSPLGWLAVWKEGLLVVILLLACIEMATRWRAGESPLRWDRIDLLIVAFAVLAFAVSFAHGVALRSIAYGVRYDLVPLVAFLVLRRVPWSERFVVLALRVLLAIGVLVAGYGVLTLLLPESFFTALGYSDLHSLYVPGRPIAAFQQIGGLGLRRIQSTMSGPNQFGIWLLVPLAIGLMAMAARWHAEKRCSWKTLIALVLLLLALLLTFSRSAWIGALVLAVTAGWMLLPRRAFARVVAGGLGILVLLVALASLTRPDVLLRAASSRDHLLRPLEAMETMVRYPLGLGLGSAGPASNRVNDACVFLEEGADTSWAAPHGDLCVFVERAVPAVFQVAAGTVHRPWDADRLTRYAQAQPTGRPCRCPFLPENWYLQIGVETGVLGFAIYLVLIITLLLRLRTAARSGAILPSVAFLSLLGVSVAALFLHAWEDSAVAYTVWVLLACAHAAGRQNSGRR